MRLPSKKIIPIITACIIATGGIIFAVFYSPKAKTLEEQNANNLVSVKSESVQNDIREIDFDSDGLKDWEESLWKSNPRVADSDGDGTQDGAEVEGGRNPMIKGPNDKITITQQVDLVAGTQQATSSQIGIAAREVFANYIAIKQSGKKLTPEMEAQIIQNSLSAAKFTTNGARVYSTSDIKITSDISTQALRNYAQAMGANIKNNRFKTEIDELLILSHAIDTRDAKDLADLDPIIDSYKKIIDGALKIPVPQPLASLHLDFINGFSSGMYADIQMKKVFDDAAVSLLALRQYNEASLAIVAAHRGIQNYYAEQSIVFSAGEDGFGFLNMIPH
ncbi:MAG: hypothetical protein M3Q63_01565 [bacterium]|nr:hypothetical protein [bacterium]